MKLIYVVIMKVALYSQTIKHIVYLRCKDRQDQDIRRQCNPGNDIQCMSC